MESDDLKIKSLSDVEVEGWELQNRFFNIARLQRLLKFEELEEEAERRIVNQIEEETLIASNHLCVLTWEVRYMDKLIESVSSNTLGLNDATFSAIGIDRNAESVLAVLETNLRKDIEQIVAILRLNPKILGETLLRANYLENTKVSQSPNIALCQAIVFSLFGNCFNPQDEKLLLKLIKHLCQLQFDSLRGIATRHESFPLTLMSIYLNYTYAKPYIRDVLKDLIVDVIQNQMINLDSNQQQSTPNQQQRRSFHSDSRDPSIILQSYAFKFLMRIIDKLPSLPYGIRWLAKSLIEFAKIKLKNSGSDSPNGMTMEDFRKNLIVNLVFENFFVPAIIKPEQYGIITGLSTDRRSRNNLIQIARMVHDFVLNPSKRDLLEEVGVASKLDKYIEQIEEVEELDDYFVEHEDVEAESPKKTRLMASSLDLFLLLELVYQNLAEPMQVTSPQIVKKPPYHQRTLSASLKLSTVEIVELIKKIQPASAALQEGMKFFILNVSTSLSQKETLKIEETTATTKVKHAKEHLLLLLRVLDHISGYQDCDLIQTLDKQRAKNRIFDTSIIEAQVKETIRTLKDLPSDYQQHNYALLLDQLFREHETRQEKKKRNMRSNLVLYEQLKRNIFEMEARKQINLEYLTYLRYKEFRAKEYDHIEELFIADFVSRFAEMKEPCLCTMALVMEDGLVCDNCKIKGDMIRNYIQAARDIIQMDALWCNATDDEISVGLWTVERNLLTQLYSIAFIVSQEDKLFSEQMKKKSPHLTFKDLLISDKYQTQAPWELAQKELRKINLYKAPHDKLKCIIDTWKIVFNYIRPLGVAGPDDYLPIMSFVILKSQTGSLISNINFISRFTSIDEAEEIPFMNFKSAIEILRDMFSSTRWSYGHMKPVTTRMKVLMQERKLEATRKITSATSSESISLASPSVTPTKPNIMDTTFFSPSTSVSGNNSDDEMSSPNVGLTRVPSAEVITLRKNTLQTRRMLFTSAAMFDSNPLGDDTSV